MASSSASRAVCVGSGSAAAGRQPRGAPERAPRGDVRAPGSTTASRATPPTTSMNVTTRDP
eukprot:6535870-Prymnesium_polylepis.1